MKKERVLILIDGSNFYFKLKNLGFKNLLEFNFSAFSKTLVDKNQLIGAKYYVGRIRQDGTKKGEQLFASQQKLLAKLRKSGYRYQLGYLLKNDGVYREKGVDVHIAVDIIIAAYENLCDRIVLVSSDTDLAPAIKKAQAKGKIVEYIGFSHQPSVAMVSFCLESRLLTKEEILKFFNKKNN